MNARDVSLMTKAVRQILWDVWDPIGVNKSPGAFGEYDSYAPKVVSLLAGGCSPRELETHLSKLETTSMGLPMALSQGRQEAVSALTALRELGSSKTAFYGGKGVRKVLWYLHDCDLPEELHWARLRIFEDGSADATFSEEGTAFGFINEKYASYLLGEDEYVCFSRFDDEDDACYGTDRHSIVPPSWVDRPDKQFEFLGTY